ncbi:MAG: PEP/pyruvate-binding domain-containing protein [Bacillota bacterium]
MITELIRPKTPTSAGGGFQRAVKSSMDSANIQRGLNPPLNEVSFNEQGGRAVLKPANKYCLTWPEAFQSGVPQAGGKGWNLGRLARYGFKIPPGVVLRTGAYDEFFRHNRLQDMVLNIAQSVTAANIGEACSQDKLAHLREKVKEGDVPQLIVNELADLLTRHGLIDRPLAVRSSAAAEDSAKASFAGIHESFLNVLGLDQVLAAVKGCYASLWSPRAVAYRRKLNIGDAEAEAAVVVMEMVEARAAGVGFTCDPRTGRRDVLVVCANFGLGESVVSGAVEPDTYYLEAGAWSAAPRILSRKIGRKEGMTRLKEGGGTKFVKNEASAARQVLPDEEIEKLGLVLARVSEALGDGEQHQDVEWVFDGRDFVLVQARPVTALPQVTFAAIKDQPEIWSNGNYRDSLPMVISPLSRRLVINVVDTIHESSYSEIGYALPEGLQFSKFFNGRLYANIAALQWAWYDSMGILPRDVNSFWGGHQPEIKIEDPQPLRGIKGLKRLQRLQKTGSLMKRTVKNAENSFTRVLFSVDVLTEKGFGHLQDRDFISLYEELGRVVRDFAREFRFLSGSGATAVGSLFKVLGKYLGARTTVIFNALMVGGTSGITSADHGYRLMELAGTARRDSDAARFFTAASFAPLAWEEQLPERSAFKQAFREFIREYGHRAVYELDLGNPRWREDPSYLLGIICGTINTADLAKLKAGQKETYKRAWQEIKDKVPFYKHPAIRKWVREAQAGAAVREMTKSVLVRAMGGYRMMAQELGSRFCQRGILAAQADVHFCTWPELFSVITGAWNGDGLKELVDERKDLFQEMESFSPPDIIMGETPRFTGPVTPASGDCLLGVAVAAGKASGPARLISHPYEGGRLQPGEVLVAPSTDPAWTPLFLKAGAVVMETGGFMSHGAIVAREYGVPAVVNIPGVMRAVKEGCKVTVDGDEGKVFLQ